METKKIKVKVGDIIEYWSWTSIDEGDNFFGEVVDVWDNGDVIAKDESGRTYHVDKKYIYRVVTTEEYKKHQELLARVRAEAWM